MDGGPQEEFCLFSRSSLQGKGCWRLLQGSGIHLGPAPLSLLSGDKDIFFFFSKWKGALEMLKLWFPSNLDRQMFLFLFTFVRQNLCWTESVFHPNLTRSPADLLLQSSWLHSPCFQSDLSPVLSDSYKWLYDVCRPTFLTFVQVRGKHARRRGSKLAPLPCLSSGILTTGLCSGLASMERHPSHS